VPTAALSDEEIAQATAQPHPAARTLPPRTTVTILAIGAAVGVVVGIVAGVALTPRTADPVPQPSATLPAVPPVKPAPATPAAPMRNVVPPIPTVNSVELGSIRQAGRVVSRDNGQSTRYGDRSIWVFADTLLRSPKAFLSNSAAATTDLRANDGISMTASDAAGRHGSTPIEFMPRTKAERDFENAQARYAVCPPGAEGYCSVTFGFWPGPVIADPARQRVLIFYDKICRGGLEGARCSGKFGTDLGTGIVALDMTTHQMTRLSATGTPAVKSIEGNDPTMFFPAGTKYASAAVVVGDDAYVYGDCDTRCRLARVPLADVTDRSKWRFFAGRGKDGAARWSANPHDAVYTVRAGAAGNTVLYDPALKGWLNVYMAYGGSTLKAQIGGSPYGPWSRTFTLRQTGAGRSGPNYAAYGHPEYAERGGLVQYMSYYQVATGAQRLVKVTFTP
jgi:hypothetical protein